MACIQSTLHFLMKGQCTAEGYEMVDCLLQCSSTPLCKVRMQLCSHLIGKRHGSLHMAHFKRLICKCIGQPWQHSQHLLPLLMLAYMQGAQSLRRCCGCKQSCSADEEIYCMCLQVHGAAEAAWSAAAATARAGLGAGCPDPAELLRKRPSMQLLPKVLELACCLRAAACLSIARSMAYGPTAACFKVCLHSSGCK